MSTKIPYSHRSRKPENMLLEAKKIYQRFNNRRTVRDFSTEPIPDGVLKKALLTAGTAPNGANLQPWHFAVVQDPQLKKEIRMAAEEEEAAFYSGRAPQEWLDILTPLGTDKNKPFLETAPALIVVLMKTKVSDPSGKLRKSYYPKESVGIATGFLIATLHELGLATLTHTPSPMKFLNKLLNRPPEEKPFLLLVVGYPARDCTVPGINRLPLGDIASFQ